MSLSLLHHKRFGFEILPDYTVENLIVNSGVEQDSDHDGIADNWTVYKISGQTDITLDKNAHTGSRSVKMTVQSAKPQNKMAYASAFVPVKGNTEYFLSCYAKSDFGYLDDWWTLSAWVYCVYYDEQGEKITQEKMQIHHVVHSWKQFSKILISPSAAAKARIGLVFNGPKDMTVPGVEHSTVWVDDITRYYRSAI